MDQEEDEADRDEVHGEDGDAVIVDKWGYALELASCEDAACGDERVAQPVAAVVDVEAKVSEFAVVEFEDRFAAFERLDKLEAFFGERSEDVSEFLAAFDECVDHFFGCFAFAEDLEQFVLAVDDEVEVRIEFSRGSFCSNECFSDEHAVCGQCDAVLSAEEQELVHELGDLRVGFPFVYC